jgi:hypothetical protein
MQAHYLEIAANKSPLTKAIYEATKNVVVWRDAPGAAIVDERATAAGRAEIENRVRQEFAAKAEEDNRLQHEANSEKLPEPQTRPLIQQQSGVS